MYPYVALLLAAHLIADFPFQTNRIFSLKMKSAKLGALHAGIVLFVALGMLYIAAPKMVWQGYAIVGSASLLHYVQDSIKVHFWDKKNKNRIIGFVGDQVLHVITACFAAVMLAAVQPASFAGTPYALLAACVAVTYAWDTALHVMRGTSGGLRRNYIAMLARLCIFCVALAVYGVSQV